MIPIFGIFHELTLWAYICGFELGRDWGYSVIYPVGGVFLL